MNSYYHFYFTDKTESEEELSSPKSKHVNPIITSGLQNDHPLPQENVRNRRTVRTDFTTIWNLFNIMGLVSMICAIIFTGATAWVFLMKIEEIALG